MRALKKCLLAHTRGPHAVDPGTGRPREILGTYASWRTGVYNVANAYWSLAHDHVEKEELFVLL